MSDKKDKAASGNHGSTSPSFINQLKADSADAWRRIYTLYEPLIRYWCRMRHVPEADIADLVQDVFQTVAKSIGSFNLSHPQGSFRGWLRTITHSRVIDWQRKNKDKARARGGSTAQAIFGELPFPSDNERFDTDTCNQEQILVQRLYVQALSIVRDHFQEKTWQAFWRVTVDGLSPKEVAKELAITPTTVRVAKSRVLNRLRIEMGEFHNEDTEQP